MKSHRGAAKRFRFTGSGKIRKNSAFRNHMLESKSPKRKRLLRRGGVVAAGDAKRIKKLIISAY
jgi:large subunit ribosomal protein L35